MQVELRSIALSLEEPAQGRPAISSAEYDDRMRELYDAAGLDWVVVYGDREHMANIAFLCGYDPRFEESLLVLGPNNSRNLIVGVEGQDYAAVVPVDIELMLCETFSLPGTSRSSAPRLAEVLRKTGIDTGEQIGLVGWKYLEHAETDSPDEPSFVPAFIVSVLDSIVGKGGTVNESSALMMHPETGIRATNSLERIASFEWAAQLGAVNTMRIVRAARPGLTEREAISHFGYAGDAMPSHPSFISSDGFVNGLRSASGRKIQYGDAVLTGVGYSGGLSARGGMMLGIPDTSFFDRLVAPYFRAHAVWYSNMRIGIAGMEVHNAVSKVLEGDGLQPMLNPGHLISLEEWMHSPVRPDSREKIRSGMVFQVDIIPGPMPTGQFILCEDTVAFADQGLRSEIRSAYPDLWGRIERRRSFMREQLGLDIREELLPLSDAAAYLPPFWLIDDLVCVISQAVQ